MNIDECMKLEIAGRLRPAILFYRLWRWINFTMKSCTIFHAKYIVNYRFAVSKKAAGSNRNNLKNLMQLPCKFLIKIIQKLYPLKAAETLYFIYFRRPVINSITGKFF